MELLDSGMDKTESAYILRHGVMDVSVVDLALSEFKGAGVILYLFFQLAMQLVFRERSLGCGKHLLALHSSGCWIDLACLF